MNIKAKNIQRTKKVKKYTLYICCTIIFIILSIVFIGLTTGWSVTFSEKKDFYVHGQKVIGTVTGYTRTGGYRRSTKHYVYRVELVVEYSSEDGTEYKLYEYIDKYKYVKDENVAVIEQEIGKQLPMIIDGKGKCLTASMNADDYNKSIGWCIAGAVMCGAICIACSTLLGITINKLIILNKNIN